MAKPLPKLPPPLLTRAQAAHYLNSSLDTVDVLIASGRLPAVQFGPRSIRIRLTDLDALLVPVVPRGLPEPEVAR